MTETETYMETVERLANERLSREYGHYYVITKIEKPYKDSSTRRVHFMALEWHAGYEDDQIVTKPKLIQGTSEYGPAWKSSSLPAEVMEVDTIGALATMFWRFSEGM